MTISDLNSLSIDEMTMGKNAIIEEDQGNEGKGDKCSSSFVISDITPRMRRRGVLNRPIFYASGTSQILHRD